MTARSSRTGPSRLLAVIPLGPPCAPLPSVSHCSLLSSLLSVSVCLGPSDPIPTEGSLSLPSLSGVHSVPDGRWHRRRRVSAPLCCRCGGGLLVSRIRNRLNAIDDHACVSTLFRSAVSEPMGHSGGESRVKTKGLCESLPVLSTWFLRSRPVLAYCEKCVLC